MECHMIDKEAPSCAYGAIITLGDCVYLHGGLDAHGASTDQLVYYDLRHQKWVTSKTKSGAPRLAHHAGFVSEGRYLNFVGGWNGTSRTSEVRSFDTTNDVWLPSAKSRGFPNGGGLSSHTVTQLDDGAALVIGRLGGLRTQRANSTVLSLKGSAERGWRFTMEEIPVASRGGHSAHALSASSLAIFGGRADQFTGMQVFVHGGESFEGMMPDRRDLRADSWVLDTAEREPRAYRIPIRNSPALASHAILGLSSESRKVKALLVGGMADDGPNRRVFLIQTKPNNAT